MNLDLSFPFSILQLPPVEQQGVEWGGVPIMVGFAERENNVLHVGK